MAKRIAIAITKNASGSIPTSYQIQRKVNDAASYVTIEANYSTGISNGNLTYKDSGQNDGGAVDSGLPDAKYEYRAYGITVDGTGAVSVSSTPADITVGSNFKINLTPVNLEFISMAVSGGVTLDNDGDSIEMKVTNEDFTTSQYILGSNASSRVNLKDNLTAFFSVTGGDKQFQNLPAIGLTPYILKFVRSGSDITMYVDGVLAETRDVSALSNFNFDWIGRYSVAYFDGSIEWMKVYSGGVLETFNMNEGTGSTITGDLGTEFILNSTGTINNMWVAV